MSEAQTEATRPAKAKRRARPSARLRAQERVIRRFVLNQPGGPGVQQGWFRNTFTGEERETLRANVLAWRRGRAYFEDGEDPFPVCKSSDGLRPTPSVAEPKGEACGHWNGDGQFVAACRLARWRFYRGRRYPPLCQEAWSFLAVLEDDGAPFWVSLKGRSLGSARRFLSMCYEVSRAGKHALPDCGITLSAELVHGRSFDYYVVRFSDPRWLDKTDGRWRKLRRMRGRYGRADVQDTFDAEASEGAAPADVA